jgi:hypothetical protein
MSPLSLFGLGSRRRHSSDTYYIDSTGSDTLSSLSSLDRHLRSRSRSGSAITSSPETFRTISSLFGSRMPSTAGSSSSPIHAPQPVRGGNEVVLDRCLDDLHDDDEETLCEEGWSSNPAIPPRPRSGTPAPPGMPSTQTLMDGSGHGQVQQQPYSMQRSSSGRSNIPGHYTNAYMQQVYHPSRRHEHRERSRSRSYSSGSGGSLPPLPASMMVQTPVQGPFMGPGRPVWPPVAGMQQRFPPNIYPPYYQPPSMYHHHSPTSMGHFTTLSGARPRFGADRLQRYYTPPPQQFASRYAYNNYQDYYSDTESEESASSFTETESSTDSFYSDDYY